MIKKQFVLPPVWRWILSGLAAVAVLIVLLARFWLPDFLKQKGEANLSALLHRPVTIGSIEISPFSLALGVSQFSIGQRDAAHGPAPLVAFERFELDLSLASVWHAAPVVSSVRLLGPQVNVVREADGRFNFSDLLEGGAEVAPDKQEKKAALPDFSLANIEISGGRLGLDDRQQKVRHVVSELTLGIPFAGTIGTQQEAWVEPHFRARVDDSLFELKGQVKPFADHREAGLALHLKDFDLMRVLAYLPPVEGLKVLSGRLDVDLDLNFIQAPGKPFSLQVKGDSALRQVALEHRGGAPYGVTADRLAVHLSEFDASLNKPIKASLALEEFNLRAKDGKAPLLSLPKLSVTDAAIDLKNKRVEVAAIALDRLGLALRRERDGQIDLVRLLVPPGSPRHLQKKPGNATFEAEPTAESAPLARKPGPAPAWQGKIARFSLEGAQLRLIDQTLDKPLPWVLEGLTLGVENLDLTGATPAGVTVAATVNQRGRLSVNGTAGWAPLAVALKLDLSNIDLVPLQGWAGGRLNALLTRGAVSVGGQLTLAGDPVTATFEGDGKLAQFSLFEPQHTADTLSFRSIDFSGLHFVSTPFSLNLKRLTIDELFARAILGADGKMNFSQWVKKDQAPAPAEVAPVESASAPEKAVPRAELPVKIGEIVIQKSRVDFTDRFIKPPYSASLTGLEGKISALGAGKRGLVDLRGAVDRSAPLAISGELDPFGPSLFMNVVARVKGVDMPAMSPYAERYLGYQLSKGKMSFDAKYFVENGQLKAENHLFLDQLTFGQRVESPDALSVPVTLAVALLKNTQGEIDLDLPLGGSLNDPDFSVAKVVFKVLGNLIVKAVTSPFALLGSMFGGGETLSQVDFQAGRVSLDVEGEKRLQTLAKALLERPGLTLEITGQADPERERLALQRGMLERRLKAVKLADTAQKGQEGSALREVVLTQEERRNGLLAVAKAHGLVVKAEATDDAIESLVLASVKVQDDDFRQLAERRGRGIRNWLVESGKVPVERVFVMVPTVTVGDGAALPGKAVFSLR